MKVRASQCAYLEPLPQKGVWISLCAAKSRLSDRDHGGKGGIGDPKFAGKVPSEVNARASPAARKSHRANCSG